jgi:topoisomerase-4 subunit A
MLGSDGIAVGMSTHILPHNFKELLEAQIAILKGEDFEIYPDFPQGGTMDVSKYEDGNGKVVVRAKIDLDGRRLLIHEIPANTTTESLIADIERAANRSKIKIVSINDYTAEAWRSKSSRSAATTPRRPSRRSTPTPPARAPSPST